MLDLSLVPYYLRYKIPINKIKLLVPKGYTFESDTLVPLDYKYTKRNKYVEFIETEYGRISVIRSSAINRPEIINTVSEIILDEC